jgi:hypothetical protein
MDQHAISATVGGDLAQASRRDVMRRIMSSLSDAWRRLPPRDDIGTPEIDEALAGLEAAVATLRGNLGGDA